jgi:LysM repeat protein
MVRFFSELDDIKTTIICDDKEQVEIIQGFIKNKDNISVKHYDGDISLFDSYGIEKEILKLRHKKVNLPSGGYIVIDKTEAMYVIDVNSGKHTKARDFNKTIFETNMEAAKENLLNSVKVEDDNYITYQIHIVKETDSIESILVKYNMSLDELKEYNDFTNLSLGMKLIIPIVNE